MCVSTNTSQQQSPILNYLAHLFLSGSNPQVQTGNFLGDWFRGNQHHVLPQRIQDGVTLHRLIDQFADEHPAMKASYQLLKPALGRYALPVVDVLQDYFLSLHFPTYTKLALVDFTELAIKNLKSQAHHLPSPFPERISMMFSQVNWLALYGTDEGMNRSFLNLSKRAKNANLIAQAWDLSQEHLPILEQYFVAFFPEINEFAKEKRLTQFKLND